MSAWRQLRLGWRALTKRAAVDREIADEVDHYYEQHASSLVRAGASHSDAQRMTRRELGDTLQVREEVRSYGWENVVENLLIDLRQGWRRLRNDRAFAFASVLTLSLGIGASTAIFSVINPVLIEALPYPDANRLVQMWDRSNDGSPLELTFGTYREIAQRTRSFESLAVIRTWQPTMAAPEPERLEGQRVSADFFRVLGVRPVLGRGFEKADDEPNAPRTALLSFAFWQRHFSGSRAVLGEIIQLDGAPFTIIGVMPQAFENVLAPHAEVWRPLQYDPAVASFETREWGHHLRLIGRLKKTTTLADARAEIAAIARTPLRELPRPAWANMDQGFTVNALQTDLAGNVKPTLYAVMGAVGLLLIIACVNVTNLLLARGARRRAELAMRAALGAGRVRLIQQLLTESLLLAVIGGALGIGVAALGMRALIQLSPAGLPRLSQIQLDNATLGFALVLTTVIGLAIGIIPALHAFGRLQADLQRNTRRTTSGGSRARAALVVAEVAVALVLLTGAGLLQRSLGRLFAIRPGFAAGHVIALQVQTGGPALQNQDIAARTFAAALESVRRVPGIRSAAFTSQLPLSGDNVAYGVTFDDGVTDESGGGAVYQYGASPGYIETMNIPLVRGRLLSERDVANAPFAVVINESMAKRVFGGADPIGKRIHVGDVSQPWFTIVGVVGDVKQASLAGTQLDAAYTTPEQWYAPSNALWLVARTSGEPASITAAIRSAIRSAAPDFPVVRETTMERLVAESAGPRRFALSVFTVFAIVALILAATGIYGLLAGVVTERTREIGVRTALGATQRQLVLQIVKQGIALAALGSVLGLAVGSGVNRALASLLFEVSPLDPGTHAAVIVLLLAAALLSCLLPAWRAARIDPSIALRAE